MKIRHRGDFIAGCVAALNVALAGTTMVMSSGQVSLGATAWLGVVTGVSLVMAVFLLKEAIS